MQEIKLIVLDIDGTLIAPGQSETTQENKRAILRAKEAGIKVTFASGRAFQTMRRWRSELDLDLPVVATNGADMRDEQREYFASYFKEETARQIASELYEQGRQFFVFIGSHTYCLKTRRCEMLEEMWRLGGMFPGELVFAENFERLMQQTQHKVQKILGWSDCTEDVQKMMCIAQKLLDVQAINTFRYNTEFLQQGITKAKGLALLADYHGIGVENIMAIGDADNDIEMIQEAGIGVAVKNAMDCVLEVADYVTDSCENSGIAKAINHLIFGEEQ